MNILDLQYVAVPQPLVEESSAEDTVVIQPQENDGKLEVIMEQIPYEMVFRSDPGALYHDLNRIQADVFENHEDGTTMIVPSVLHKEAREYYSSFGLNCPYKIIITKDGVPIPHLELGKKDTISKHRVFALRPYATDEKIVAARQKKEQKRLEAAMAKQGQTPSDNTVPDGPQQEGGKAQEPPEEKRKPGRPPGSKNKKTLEREAELARLAADGKAPEKRKRGRPPGSKNKKTLEREAREQSRQKRLERTAKKAGVNKNAE